MEIFIFIFPLLSSLVSLVPFFYNHLNIAYFIHCFLIICSFSISIFLFIKLFKLNIDLPLYFYPLIQLDYFRLNWSLRLDLNVATFISLITFISSMVMIYSINIFKDKILNLKFMSRLSSSTFGTLMLISSNNLIQFFISWQIIVLSLFFLAKFANQQTILITNSKTFIYNRFSDLGLFLSLYILYKINNSIYFETILDNNNLIENISFLLPLDINVIELAVFLLFISFLLRFRQFFSFNSIYDIKNIHSPALTLIFSAISMPLGTFIILRFFPLIQNSTHFLDIVIILSFVLTLIFIYILLKETNVKYLISYLAASQTSTIIFILCLKEYHAAIFYLITSSLSVTMLFLSLGFVVSKLDNGYNVNNMGGLVFKMPSTFLFSCIAFLSISGIPFFSGFYSNQIIVSSFYYLNQPFLTLSFLLVNITSLMISYILLKNILLIFWGTNRGNIHQFKKVNESSIFKKFVFFCLSLCLVISGWFMTNIFDGSNAAYFWSLMQENSHFPINSDIASSGLMKKVIIYVSLLGMFFAALNYIFMPLILNNYNLKYNKIVKFYEKYFLL